MKFAALRITFSNWPGNEDVIALCEQYVTSLREFLHDGKAKGFMH
jgi:hypothetical protein